MQKNDSLYTNDQDEEILGIENTVHDLIEAWYSADAERMRRSLHQELVKRSVYRHQADRNIRLRRTANTDMMVGWTEKGGGSDLSKEDQTYEIEVYDYFRHIASAKVISHTYIDYLHLAKIDGVWLIVNDLWELREGEFDS
jgi:hypothetical protein